RAHRRRNRLARQAIPSRHASPERSARARGPRRVSFQKEITLHVGGVHASAEPTMIKTLLGSCVAVCLWDECARVGGMNHFLLPDGRPDGPRDEATRFGVHAMDCLVGEMLKLGADPRRIIAKVFGGASVLALAGSAASVPQANVAFVRAY